MAEQEQGEALRKLTVEELSGGAGLDPRTGTIGGPDGPTGVILTEGGAAGEPLGPQGKDGEPGPDPLDTGAGGGRTAAPAGHVPAPGTPGAGGREQGREPEGR